MASSDGERRLRRPRPAPSPPASTSRGRVRVRTLTAAATTSATAPPASASAASGAACLARSVPTTETARAHRRLLGDRHAIVVVPAEEGVVVAADDDVVVRRVILVEVRRAHTLVAVLLHLTVRGALARRVTAATVLLRHGRGREHSEGEGERLHGLRGGR